MKINTTANRLKMNFTKYSNKKLSEKFSVRNAFD